MAALWRGLLGLEPPTIRRPSRIAKNLESSATHQHLDGPLVIVGWESGGELEKDLQHGVCVIF